jgi:pimeloyl-ACP methyl ester carboxylesterase
MVRAGAAAIVLSLLVGCASDVALQDERRTEPYAGILARGAALRGGTAYVRAEDPGAPPLAMHVREVGVCEGRRPGPVLVLHCGVMSDHSTWRFLAPLLGERYDILMVDPPGTGFSDKPDPACDADAYSPTWLGRHALRAVRSWSARRGDRRPLVLVGHSLGSLAILRALADPATCHEMPDVCARVRRLVLLEPPDLAMEEVDEQFEEMARLSGIEAELGGTLGIIGSRIEEGVYESVRKPEERALRREADRLTRIVVRPDTRHPMQAMLRRFRPLDARERPDWPAIRAQVAEHRNVRWPVLILWGEHDATMKPPMAYAVADQLPDARVEIVPDAKHSPHQEQPQFVFERIVRFLDASR